MPLAGLIPLIPGIPVAFSERGLPSACLSAAMRQPHTRDEHVATADLKRLADYLLEIGRAHV